MASMAEVKAAIAAAQAEAAALKNVKDSAIAVMDMLSTRVNSLKQELADAIANGGNAADLQEVLTSATALATELDGSKDSLAAAIQANTVE